MVAVAVLGLAGSGAVAQGVSFSGSAGMGVKYSGATKGMRDTRELTDAGAYESDEADAAINKEVTTMESTIKWVSDFDIKMTASGTTDGGLTFGAAATIKAGNGSSVVGNSNVYIGGESWTISIGDLDPASIRGRPLGDIGYDGLGVDDVAENIKHDIDGKEMEQGTKADVEVSFTLGAAELGITAGQTPGSPYTVAKPIDADADGGKVSPAVDQANATKEDTEWAAGVKFGIGSTNLGIGIDSEKRYQASIGADLGAFAGTLYYSQQTVDGPKDLGLDGEVGGAADNADKTRLDNKLTGIGVALSVSAGANTTINAMYTQGKQSDTRGVVDYDADGNETAALDDKDAAKSKTDKGFGVGVSHILGGGATLQAGFGKVKKQTMASVGVTMSF